MEVLEGKILVLEPRRLAARMSALRVASEMGERPGERIGWHMRFDSHVSKATRVIFLTEGMLTALISQDPNLTDVSCVILDEFHERHQQTDVAFAMLAQLRQARRPDLRLLVMSATLDSAVLQQALPDAKLISLELPLHPVALEYRASDQSQSLVERASDAVLRAALDLRHQGHILVFLPGTAEILKTKTMLKQRLPIDDWLILELRGSLDKTTQDLAFAATSHRKVILATNIAESAITIPGVTAVIDSGLARVPSFNPFTGMASLETRPVAKSSLIQRAGRAGRTGPGIAIRLFSPQDEAARPDHETPEILRLDLAPVDLALRWIATKTNSQWIPESLPWLSPPDKTLWRESRDLLERLGFINQHGALIDRKAPLLPVHPRISRFAQSLVDEGYWAEAPWLTAILAAPDEAPAGQGDQSHLGCDILARYDSLRSQHTPSPTLLKTATQLARLMNLRDLNDIKNCAPPHELDLAIALLKAFPDRVMQARNRSHTNHWIDATLCLGGDVRLSKQSAASHGQWLIAIDASAARMTGSAAVLANAEANSTSQLTVTLASQITATQLQSTQSQLLTVEDVREWDERAGKFRLWRKTKYGVLQLACTPISEAECAEQSVSPSGQQNPLIEQLRKSWPKPFDDANDFDSYIIRQQLAFSAGLVPHVWDQNELFELLISHMCDEAKSFGDIKARPLLEWIRHCVGEEEFALLQRLAPLDIKIGAGYRVKVNYRASSSPWIEARLQNFFGQAATPKILNDNLPLTVHLLAPNMRALQVTTDLAGFWKRVYPGLRNEYQRKYPRHFWPENPMEAEPPPLKTPRKPR
jgi:ATP-dependent helicase HrpB